MLNRLIIGENSLDPTTWETYDVENVCAFLVDRYGDTFPTTARIYHNDVSQATDVTPTDEAGVERLEALEGTFYVVVYPEDPITIIVAVVAVAVTAAAAFLLAPKIPSVAERGANATNNRQSSSPNNSLSNRQNGARINERIPDIYGKVRSTPDLIAVPYKTFINHEEVEYALMCIGRGHYNVDSATINDDTTPITDIAGASVEVFAPFTSPNSGDAPQLRVGTAISEPIYAVQRNEAVNGQVLRAPNANSVNGNNDIYFVYPDEIRADQSDVDFTDYFFNGDTLTITNAATNGIDLAGTYTVLSVSSDTVVLSNPSSVNAAWNTINTLTDSLTDNTSASLETTSDKWVGPFTINAGSPDIIVANFVASNGLYKDNGSNQTKTSVEVELEVTPVNAQGVATGAVTTTRLTVDGSATTRSRRAGTLRAPVSGDNIYEVRARRVTEADLSFNGTVVDEIKWRDVYAMERITDNDFGNVTIVQSVTYATSGALAVKNRKLSMEVSRLIPQRDGNGFTTTRHETSNAADIIAHACLDPFIGGRVIGELDLDSIYDTVTEVGTYFGNSQASEFNYTFDNANLSFEESIAAIAGAVFCTAYRRGNIIKLKFERATDDSTLLFNHRNKLPGSETRSISFGTQNDHDGVEYEWVDPVDDALVTMYVPASATATNPKKVESIGVRNKLQAHFHANRVWQKVQYQNVATEFNATQEADLLVISDRVLVADNTRPDTLDGDVLGYDGLSVTLSQPFTGTGTHTIFLQHYDGSVESLQCVATDDPYVITLTTAPRLPLVHDRDMYARTVYQIVGSIAPREHAFLVTEKTPQNNFTYNVLAVNYDSRYYSHDTDYINGVVDQYGEPT